MITLYTFGPAFGLPDPSPFVTKAEVLLKMAGLPYRTQTGGYFKAPKRKLPFIDDAGTIVADSTFIRLYLEQRHGIEFDARLSAAERGVAWAFEKMCEDHLYWAAVSDRWLDNANFDRGPRMFFTGVPQPLRPLVIYNVRRNVRRWLYGQGMGRHSRDEIAFLAGRALAAIADFLGDKPYLMGKAPCGADATIFAFTLGLLCPRFESPIRTRAEAFPNLVAYRDRLLQQYFPEHAAKATART
jgi:glutathione S-transferase